LQLEKKKKSPNILLSFLWQGATSIRVEVGLGEKKPPGIVLGQKEKNPF